MSIPEHINIEKKAFKPHLKYNIGDVVFLNSDFEKKYPMQIKRFDLNEDSYSDYYVTWLNSQGKPETEAYPEECLTLNN